MTDTDEILFETRGRVGLVTLNRPKALNALTLTMVTALRAHLSAWADDDAVAAIVIQGAGEKGFCAGGDIRALADSSRDGTSYATDFFAEEYRTNLAVGTYPKPYVAILDGITMGGGVGLSVHAPFRVLTPRTVFAMPETGIGLIPDVGGSHILPRLPGKLGMYLGLTGARLKAADSLYAGVGTHYVTDDTVGSVVNALIGADFGPRPFDTVDEILRAHASDPGEAPLAANRAAIDKHFVGETVEAIQTNLQHDEDHFCAEQCTAIASKSPTSLKLTHRLIREGAVHDLAGCLRQEFRVVSHIMNGHDFGEGVRAVIVDKDNKPRWSPETLEAVTPAMVNGYFADLGDKELRFDSV